MKFDFESEFLRNHGLNEKGKSLRNAGIFLFLGLANPEKNSLLSFFLG